MKAVLIAVVGLLAISAQAQDCGSPTYKEQVVLTCPSKQGLRLPNYANVTQYYDCGTGKPVLKQCTSPSGYFTNVYQECTSCAQYIPAVECSSLTWNVKCEPLSAAATTVTAPTTKTTAEPTTKTTKETTVKATTASGPPTPPGPTGTPNPNDPSGTTIFVPQPPSPNDPNVPAPPTPAPTVGTIATGPPNAP